MARRATGLDGTRSAVNSRRRPTQTFVADELIEAGFPGTALPDGVMRLTGLEEEQAQAAIAAAGASS